MKSVGDFSGKKIPKVHIGFMKSSLLSFFCWLVAFGFYLSPAQQKQVPLVIQPTIMYEFSANNGVFLGLGGCKNPREARFATPTQQIVCAPYFR